MPQYYSRKYGVSTFCPFVLFEVDGVKFRTDATPATADTNIMKDEGAETSTSTLFVDEGTGYSMPLSATEMSAARIVVYVSDAITTQTWLDDALIIETYGNPSAQHPIDFGTAISAQSVISVTGGAQASAVTALENLSAGSVVVQTTSALTNYTAAQASAITALENISAGTVLVQATSALTVYDAPTKAEMDAAHALLATGSAITALENISAGTVLTQATSALTTYDPPTKAEMDTAHGLLATGSAVTALENISAGTVLTQSTSALTTYDPPTKAEMDTGHALLGTTSALTVVDTTVDAIKAKTDNLPEAVQKNVAFPNFGFTMVQGDGTTPATDLTITGQRALDGATSFTNVTGSIVEVAAGAYKFSAAQADTNGDTLLWKFSSGTALTRMITIKTVT